MKNTLLTLIAVLFAGACAYMEKFGHIKDIPSLKALAEQGYAIGQNNLGMMYAKGLGVEKDFNEALKWYRKSAEQGDARGQYNLGEIYRKGQGVEKDYVSAYAWYNIVAANGMILAKIHKTSIATEMTPEQIAKAEALTKEMLKKNPKLILEEKN